jgi:protein-S-isoprenylcysteine O-methyltransferase Ste14
MNTFPLLLIAVCWLVFFVYWIVASFEVPRQARGRVPPATIGMRIMFSLLAILLIGLSRAPDVASLTWLASAPGPITAPVGVALCASGIAFAIWARRHLGHNWGMPMTTRTDTVLITSGPYTYVRHPIYTGILLAMLGSALVNGAMWIIVFIGLCIYFTYSAQKEERTMTERFPADYPAYQRRSKMLIPFVW